MILNSFTIKPAEITFLPNLVKKFLNVFFTFFSKQKTCNLFIILDI